MVRVKRGMRQRDVAERASLSRSEISWIERGFLDRVALRSLRVVGNVLGVSLELNARWRGADLDRMLNQGHARLREQVARWLEQFGWEHRPEVSFSIWGERGVIDILAYHAGTRSLLIIELKTELASIEPRVTRPDGESRRTEP